MRSRAGRCSRLPLLIVLCALGPTILWGNPFIGTGDTPRVAPVQAGGATLNGLAQSQVELRNKLAAYLGTWQESRSAGLLSMILGVSFLYGILHALGPGHRKTVIFSVYLARKAPWWEPMASSLALTGLHGSAAILLLLVFRGVSQAISVATDSIAVYMEGGAYCLLIVMAVFLLAQSIIDLARGRTRVRGAVSLGTLILTGAYPCPGAILVLVLSLTLEIMGMGILAVVSMSLGMSIPIAIFAYLGWLGRTGLLGRLKSNEAVLRKAGAIVEVVGFSLLLLFAIYIALPFITSVAALVR